MSKFIRKGSGPTLILQHGFLSGAAYWQKQIDYFSEHFDVIATNLPGFSDNTSDANDSILQCAEFVIDVADELEIDRFHLVGHSMGGMIAQEVAIQFPQRVDKLVLYGTGPNGKLPGRFEPIEESLKRVETQGPGDTIEKTVASWFKDLQNDKNFAEALKLAKTAPIASLPASYRAWLNWNALDRLHKIHCQTLVVWGDLDRSYNWSQPETLWKNISQSRLAVLPDCSHNAHLENPKLFNLILNGFLSS